MDVSRVGGKYPVLLGIGLEDFKYKEVEPFVGAFREFCRATWRVAPEARSEPKSPPASPDNPARGQSQKADAARPWEQIPDHLWDRRALKLWWEDHTCPEIGEIIHQSAKTVLNRLSALRKTYGEAIVPTDRQRRRRPPKVGTLG